MTASNSLFRGYGNGCSNVLLSFHIDLTKFCDEKVQIIHSMMRFSYDWSRVLVAFVCAIDWNVFKQVV